MRANSSTDECMAMAAIVGLTDQSTKVNTSGVSVMDAER